MTDTFLPLSVEIASVKFRYLDSTGVSRNPLTGAVRTASRGGDKVGASLEFTPSGGASSTGKQRARKVRSTLFVIRGKQGKLVFTDPSYTISGSFPTAELLTNPEFNDGSTGYAAASESTVSVTDSVLRVTRAGQTAGSAYATATASAQVQYAPYVYRAFISAIRGGAIPGVNASTNTVPVSPSTLYDVASTPGYRKAVYVATSASAPSLFLDNIGPSGYISGDYYDVAWNSYSRCAVADSGPNALTRSDEFDHSDWAKTNATVTANFANAPNGTLTGDALVEDTTSGGHYLRQTVTVSSSAADYAFCIAVNAGTRSWAQLRLIEATGVTAASAFFNLSTGAVGTVSTGANWSNLRTFSVGLGSGWYVLCVVARKTNAATSILVDILAASADGTNSYSGTASAKACYLWRGTFAQSSFPVRLTQTISSSTSGTSQTGSEIYLKGLPASTAGLLLADDWFEVVTSIGSQLCKVSASLDSDAAGRGCLQFAPAIRGSVSDNAAVIPYKPMGRFLFSGDVPEYANESGVFTTTSLDLEESPF